MIIKKVNNIIKKILYKLFLSKKHEIFYVNGPETLPPPLNKKDEETIMNKILSGEPISVREPLITHNLRLVVYIAKKFDSSGVPIEDLISIGSIGLIKAVNTFSPERNIKLATYASRCIENEILMYLRKNAQTKNETSIDEPLNIDRDGNELLFCDILGSDKDNISSKLEQEAECVLVRQAVENLSSRDKHIMKLRFGLYKNKEHTQKEVADLMGISQSYISRLEKKIINKLKKDIEKVS